MKLHLAFSLFFLLSFNALAQTEVLSILVTFQFEKTRLKDALSDLSERYDIQFSYSSKTVNVRQRVTAQATGVPLETGLKKLFEQTDVAYMVIGGHIVLKHDPAKTLSEIKTKPPKKERKKAEPPLTEEAPILVSEDDFETEPVPEPEVYPIPDSIIALNMLEARPLQQKGKMYPGDQTLLNFEKWRMKKEYQFGPKRERKFAQVSVLPTIGTNMVNADETTNNFSMNLLWGETGGVDGLEVGTVMNTVRKDVRGFQAAGLGNRVGRNVTGTQVGGIFNKNAGMTTGLQAAGIINLTNNVQAAQAAGAVNWSTGDVAGIQASGLLNRVGGNADALQVGGLFNFNNGNAKAQVGGLINKANDVHILQLGGLMNRATGNARAFQAAGLFNFNRGNAKIQVGGLINTANDVGTMQFGGFMNVAKGEVKGFQIGLINISDTVSGVPIGLINIVKRGYNKFEIYGSETLHGNFQLKLGANAFYNIFHIGAQVPPGDGTYIWGLGYGIGTVTTLSKKATMNWELMAIHISENEGWTNTLNSIAQARTLWNFQIGRSIGFFFGPTANVMVSQLRNPETGKISSPVVPYALIDEDLNSKTNLKAWLGINAGFRF